MPGVFISRGMTVAIPPGGLTIGVAAHGTATAWLVLHVMFDVCPTWTDLALRHLADAKTRRTARESAWTENVEDEKGASLERGFEASMQASVRGPLVAVEQSRCGRRTGFDICCPLRYSYPQIAFCLKSTYRRAGDKRQR